VKIKNTSAVPLRAAYLHGPYTVYVACYPSTYDPNKNHTKAAQQEGAPEFEPQLKAGGSWHAKLTLPEDIRKDADKSFFTGEAATQRKSFTWVIEVASQVLFSTTAAVHFEVLVGRDAKSVELGFHGVVGSGQGAPGRLEDHQQGRLRDSAQSRGVFSKAVRLSVDDTESLWNTPAFPHKDDEGRSRIEDPPQHGDKRDVSAKEQKKSKKQRKIHLVLLTHGLHSNLGADMLYMKESIDTAARQARQDAKQRRAHARAKRAAEMSGAGRADRDSRAQSTPEVVLAPTEKYVEEEEDSDSDEEETLVRGFNGNAVKTEKGIQYLGKRFAKYVLLLTYPTQPYLPVKSSLSKSITRSLTGSRSRSSEKPKDSDVGASAENKTQIHKNSTILKDEKSFDRKKDMPYRITSISFVGHSLGGLVQTYAVAYIQKHSPDFFELIKPVNFVALATPFLGLSNENPIYVKFALDFGLVGRTGQDLGLTWRAPTFAKNSWSTMISGLGVDTQKDKQGPDPSSKPLLRILPTGPAHVALKKFRNRSVYANVVNDGIVPLRTSCLLFLDWRGLGRVDKARRDNGLVGTMLEWGWTEMTGQNASAPRKPIAFTDLFNDDDPEPLKHERTDPEASPDPGSSVPQADASQGFDDADRNEPDRHQFLDSKPLQDEVYSRGTMTKPQETVEQASNLWTGLLSFFRPQAGKQKSDHKTSPKQQKIYRRGQTMKIFHDDDASTQDGDTNGADPRKTLVRGPSLYSAKSGEEGLEAPPKTTVFESAGDLLHPPLPPKDFILDPGARPRTIFHDRVYHPDDIPTPPPKKQRTLLRKASSRENSITGSSQSSGSSLRPPSQNSDMTEAGSMRIEEKIARAYHRDLTWRKVLVRLEPDAHNNMIVRRMFANAYGWPVVQHMCDTHFGYTAAAHTRDEEIESEERAQPLDSKVHAHGEHVQGQTDPPDENARPKSGEDGSKEPKKPQKAATMDDITSTPASPQDVNAIHDDLKRSPTSPDATNGTSKSTNRTSRTASEAREASDEVSDLVSRVTASGRPADNFARMRSSRSSLQSLARRDSALWSDHFFEDEEGDEDDDEEYIEELRKARQRGDYLTREELSILDNGKISEESGGKIARSLSKKSRNSERSIAESPSVAAPGSVDKLIEEARITREPGEMTPDEQIEESDTNRTESGQNHGVDEQLLSLTGIGLQKTVEEQVGAPESPTHRSHGVSETGGLTEHVASPRKEGSGRDLDDVQA
jgi:hypothetical protein